MADVTNSIFVGFLQYDFPGPGRRKKGFKEEGKRGAEAAGPLGWPAPPLPRRLEFHCPCGKKKGKKAVAREKKKGPEGKGPGLRRPKHHLRSSQFRLGAHKKRKESFKEEGRRESPEGSLRDFSLPAGGLGKEKGRKWEKTAQRSASCSPIQLGSDLLPSAFSGEEGKGGDIVGGGVGALEKMFRA